MAARKTKSAAQKSGAKFTPEEDLQAYRDMLLIRRFEEKAGQMYGMGLIGGFCHLYIGQEAVVVGMQMALGGGRSDDHLLPRPWPHAGLRHGCQGRDGRIDGPPGRLLKRQGRLHAHVQPGKELLRRPRHCGCTGSRSAPAWRFANKYRGQRPRVGHLSSAKALPTRGRSMRASTWLPSGSCRSSS